MADMMNLSKQTNNGRRSRKGNLKVDLTAMVDLGFLLISFFMLSTSFDKPKQMDVFMPNSNGPYDPTEIKLTKTVSLMLGQNGMIYSYQLPDMDFTFQDIAIDSFEYSAAVFRKLIFRYQDKVARIHGDKKELFIFIKPLENSRFETLVSVLDEMNICNVARYAIVKPESEVDQYIFQKIINTKPPEIKL